jgi:hypothetical protein
VLFVYSPFLSHFFTSPLPYSQIYSSIHTFISLFILHFPALFTIISTISFQYPIFSLFCLRKTFPTDYCHVPYNKEYS